MDEEEGEVKHYWAVVGLLLVVLLVIFGMVEAAEVPLLADPDPAMDDGGIAAAAIDVGLLVADVALPVPSSGVMLAHGALFGVVVGSLLSLIGSVGAALLGFAIGRRSGGLLARVGSTDERARADHLLARWGLLAVVVTRPVPLLAEAVALVAGASSMPLPRVVVGTVVGVLPAAVLYALASALATTLVSGALVFVVVVALAGVTWLVGELAVRRSFQARAL